MPAARGRTGNLPRNRPMRALTAMLCLLLVASPAPAQTTGSELPDIGNPANTALSLED